MEKVYDKKLFDYIDSISEKITTDKLDHIMKTKKDFVLYYCRKDCCGGNYTVNVKVEIISMGYDLPLELQG